MRILVADQELLVSWKHLSEDVIVPATKPGKKDKTIKFKTTECFIRPYTKQRPVEPVENIGSSSVTFDITNNLSKNGARKASLHLLLQNLYPGMENKKLRRAFWETYDKIGRGLAGQRKIARVVDMNAPILNDIREGDEEPYGDENPSENDIMMSVL